MSLANRKEKTIAFARVVEFTAKRSKAKEVASALNDRVMPILHKQSGFVDAIMLPSTTQPDQLLSLSFWRSAAELAL